MKTFIVKIQVVKELEGQETRVLDNALRCEGLEILAYAFKEVEIPKLQEEN